MAIETQTHQERRLGIFYAERLLPRWWDRIVIVGTVLTIGILILDFGLAPESVLSLWLQWIDLALCGLFLTDFAWRMRVASNPWIFLRRNWFDLIGAIPFLGPLRAVRVVRMMRLLRIMRVFVLLNRSARAFEWPPAARALGYLGVTAVVWWGFAAFAFTVFERGANNNIKSVDDALWWSITTLSTVGYGDIYPSTGGGRLVAALTMALGVGVLGTFGGTVATMLLDIRDQGKRGLRPVKLRNHLLVLGWNDKGRWTIAEFKADPRYKDTRVVVVAQLPETPVTDDEIRFVRGLPSLAETLERAAASGAAAAIILANDEHDARSDHETALVVAALRRVNPSVRISAELVAADNREHLRNAGCDAIIDAVSFTAGLLVRGVQDVGVPALIMHLLTSDVGSEIYRVPVEASFLGKPYREYVLANLDRRHTVIALERACETILHPDPAMPLIDGDVAFLVAKDAPA